MVTLLQISCFLFQFYIKPQLIFQDYFSGEVVSYSNFTSNHNRYHQLAGKDEVVSYSNFTSNHNLFSLPVFMIEVVSYSNFTSNHNSCNDEDVI